MWQRIKDRLTPEFCVAVDELLVAKEDGRSTLFQLNQYPPEPTPAAINAYLDRFDPVAFARSQRTASHGPGDQWPTTLRLSTRDRGPADCFPWAGGPMADYAALVNSRSRPSYCQPICNEPASSHPPTAKRAATNHSFHCHGARAT
jgi:hypothetical protein